MSTSYYPHWKDAKWDDERWPNFSVKEFAQRKSDYEIENNVSRGDYHAGLTPVIINTVFLDRVQILRNKLGKPISISSGYRSPIYNSKVSKTGRKGPHTTGRAIDVPAYGDVRSLLYYAVECGFTGIGIRQNGAYQSRIIHLDDLNDDETPGPRPWVWTY